MDIPYSISRHSVSRPLNSTDELTPDRRSSRRGLSPKELRRSLFHFVGGAGVAAFRCYLMSGGHIQAVQICEGVNDAEVILKGFTLLKSKPEHQAIEIWEGKRMVAHISRSDLSAGRWQDN